MVKSSSRRRFEVPLLAGMALLAGIVIFDLSGLSDLASWSRWPRLLLSLAGVVLLGWGAFLWKTTERTFDERFLLHRLKASRAALVAGMASILIWLVADLLSRPAVFRWQLLAILAVMTVTKIGAMVYYRRTD